MPLPTLFSSCRSTALRSQAVLHSLAFISTPADAVLVSFHCYAGTYTQQAAFTAAFPNKEVYMTGEPIEMIHEERNNDR
jgi:O-glycosyl hydrolase